MHRTVTRFGLIVTVALLTAANVAAQQAPSAAGPRLQPDAGGEAAVVKRVVDGIMQPYLAQGQRGLPRGRNGADLLIWERLSRFRYTAIATSCRMEKLPTRARPKHALQRTGAKHFSLMSHWFYSMIGFGRAAQIQEGNENVV